jgi:hypothetical protein
MKVLQTFALPLGYRASEKISRKKKNPTSTNRGYQKLRAFIKSLAARTLLPTYPATRTTTSRTARNPEFVSEKHLQATYRAVRDMSTAFFPVIVGAGIRLSQRNELFRPIDFAAPFTYSIHSLCPIRAASNSANDVRVIVCQILATVSYPMDACSSQKTHFAIANSHRLLSLRESPR